MARFLLCRRNILRLVFELRLVLCVHSARVEEKGSDVEETGQAFSVQIYMLIGGDAVSLDAMRFVITCEVYM